MKGGRTPLPREIPQNWRIGIRLRKTIGVSLNNGKHNDFEVTKTMWVRPSWGPWVQASAASSPWPVWTWWKASSHPTFWWCLHIFRWRTAWQPHTTCQRWACLQVRHSWRHSRWLFWTQQVDPNLLFPSQCNTALPKSNVFVPGVDTCISHLLFAKGRQADDNLNWINIMSNHNQLCALLLNHSEHSLGTRDQARWWKGSRGFEATKSQTLDLFVINVWWMNSVNILILILEFG